VHLHHVDYNPCIRDTLIRILISAQATLNLDHSADMTASSAVSATKDWLQPTNRPDIIDTLISGVGRASQSLWRYLKPKQTLNRPV